MTPESREMVITIFIILIIVETSAITKKFYRSFIVCKKL